MVSMASRWVSHKTVLRTHRSTLGLSRNPVSKPPEFRFERMRLSKDNEVAVSGVEGAVFDNGEIFPDHAKNPGIAPWIRDGNHDGTIWSQIAGQALKKAFPVERADVVERFRKENQIVLSFALISHAISDSEADLVIRLPAGPFYGLRGDIDARRSEENT